MTTTHYKTPRTDGLCPRRGALLLLVLLMLTIFLVIGILALTIASRSRTTARAFRKTQIPDIAASSTARLLLDQALMKLIRGPSSPGSTNDIPESLLEDMYAGERDLNRNGRLGGPNVDDVSEVDLDGDNALSVSDSLTGRLVNVGPTNGPLTEVTVDVFFENHRVDSDGLWVAAQDLNNNGMFDPRPGVDTPLPPPTIPPPSTWPDSAFLRASKPTAFNGRVITFAPAAVQQVSLSSSTVTASPAQSFPTVSLRIVRSAFFGGEPSPPVYQCRYTFQVADLVNDRERRIPAQPPRIASGSGSPLLPLAPCDIVINGPAFRVDPCDHPLEPWIATFAGNQVDNDNDSQPDGKWLSGVLPPIQLSDGKRLDCDVSILVKDLDGRINLNAHGAARRNSQTGRPYDGRSEYGVTRRTVPVGLGFGPADIDASALFAAIGSRTNPTETGFDPQRPLPDRAQPGAGVWRDGRPLPLASTWKAVLFGDEDLTVSDFPPPAVEQRRPAPVLGSAPGRYSGAAGTLPAPGLSGQDAITQNSDSEFTIAPYGQLTGKANSFSDLKSRMQVFTERPKDGKGCATLVFYTPDTDSDLVDDPYEIRLDRDGPRLSTTSLFGHAAADNVFTLAELERVLRQFDADAAQLPSRLTALLGSRLNEDRNENGVLDPAEEKREENKNDDEDKKGDNLPPNGILDDGEDLNNNGYLDLEFDKNNSGFQDIEEDRPTPNSKINRYWPFQINEPTPTWKQVPRQSWERDYAQPLRDLVTTDSWDTPSLTGEAARKIQKYLADNPLVWTEEDTNRNGVLDTGEDRNGNLVLDSAAFSPDLLSGLRFDLNRPFPSIEEDTDRDGTLDSGEDTNGNGVLDSIWVSKQAFCKHLFYLIRALGEPDTKIAAQWAVNVVDFRDSDSVITVFEYDPTPDDGWHCDDNPATNDAQSGIVFGVERPELLILETASWVKNPSGAANGQLFTLLYRPWNAIHRRLSSPHSTPPSTSISLAEPIDFRLTGGLTESGDSNLNGIANEPCLNLQLRSQTTPVWRLKVATSATTMYVRFDELTNPPAANERGANRPDPATRQTLDQLTKLPTNTYLCVAPASIPDAVSTIPNRFGIDIGNMFVSQSGTMELQRLADPTRPFDIRANPHVTVDQLGIKTIDRSNDPPQQVLIQSIGRSYTDSKLTSPFEDRPIPSSILTNLWRSTKSSGPADQDEVSLPAPLAQLDPIDYIAPWMHWPNRPYISVAELILTPTASPDKWLRSYSVPFINPTNPIGSPAELLLFDACHVYSRFAGNRISLSPEHTVLQTLGASTIPFDQLSRWREPGRVNIYTATSVVKELIAGRRDRSNDEEYPELKPTDLKPPTQKPMGTLLAPQAKLFQSRAPEIAIKSLGAVDAPDAKDHIPFDPSLNAFFLYSTAIRLPNLATTRSHMFAVWITLRLKDTDDPTRFQDYRLFAIIDRSIPVGFIHGMDLNVRDVIALQRFLD